MRLPLAARRPGFLAKRPGFEPNWIPGFTQSEVRFYLLRLTTDSGLDRYDAGRGVFRDVQDGRFVERTAKRGRRYAELPLYEAAYEPERIQFYRLVDIPFARELRKVGVDHPFADPGGQGS